MKRLKLIDELKSEYKNCNLCSLSTLRNSVVFGEGNLEARIVMIGEAPGVDEDLEGKPFIGEAGKIFERLLNRVGIKREDIWVTNTCLCRPVSTVDGKPNRAPRAKEVKACKPRLFREIDIITPEIIVLSGNTPLYMATKKRGITKLRGWQKTAWSSESFWTNKVYATLHPSSLLHGSKEQQIIKANWLLEDWTNIAEALLGKKENATDETEG